MLFKKERIIVSGRQFFYWEGGNMKKSAMVFLHGFPGNHLGLLALAEELGKKYRLILPDMPGCGQSDMLGKPHQLENYATWLDGFLTALLIDSVVIVGHSFGARLAVVFGAKYPKKAIALVLVTPVTGVHGFIARIVTLYYEIAAILPDYLEKMMITSRFGKTVGNMILFKSADAKLQKEIISRDVSEIKKLNQVVVDELFDEFHDFPFAAWAQKITIKSLVIAADKDIIAPLASIEELMASLPGAKLEVVENSGHLVPLEQPVEVATIINHFLSL